MEWPSKTGFLIAFALAVTGCVEKPNESCHKFYDDYVENFSNYSAEDRPWECIQYYSYKYAKADGSIGDIADAVLEKCRLEIRREPLRSTDGLNYNDKEQVDRFERNLKYFDELNMGHAKLAIVEARAFKCTTAISHPVNEKAPEQK